MLFALGDIVYQAFIAGVVTMVMAYMAQRASAKAEEVKLALARSDVAAAQRAAELAHTVGAIAQEYDHKLTAIAKTGEAVHVLVNSNMAIQLKLNATVTRRLANMTHDETDGIAADLAEQLFHEHERKQKQVDAQAAKS